MHQESAQITAVTEVAGGIYTLEFESPRIARETLAGQFLNLKPDSSYDPFLRRAYSVHRIRGTRVEVIFNIVGKGSAILAAKKAGDTIDVVGPLGIPFHLDSDYSTAILVSGGVGIAPMPVLGDALEKLGKHVLNIHGARNAGLIVDDGRLVNVQFATDDGSAGIHGTVVTALEKILEQEEIEKPRLFSCGPNKMLQALGELANMRGIPLEVSLECQMACGVGICQGCPVEMATGNRKYTLVCTHGPNYDFNDLHLESLPSVH